MVMKKKNMFAQKSLFCLFRKHLGGKGGIFLMPATKRPEKLIGPELKMRRG